MAKYAHNVSIVSTVCNAVNKTNIHNEWKRTRYAVNWQGKHRNVYRILCIHTQMVEFNSINELKGNVRLQLAETANQNISNRSQVAD